MVSAKGPKLRRWHDGRDGASPLSIVRPPQPNQRVVRRLEELLTWARDGRLRAFVLAGVVDEPGEPNSTIVVRAGIVPIAPIVVALERAKLRTIGFVEDHDIDLDLGGN